MIKVTKWFAWHTNYSAMPNLRVYTCSDSRLNGHNARSTAMWHTLEIRKSAPPRCRSFELAGMTQQHADQQSAGILCGYPERMVLIPTHTVKVDPAGRAFFSRRRWCADRCRRPGAPASPPALPLAAPSPSASRASAADSRAACSAGGGCASARPYLRGSSDKPQNLAQKSMHPSVCDPTLLHALPAM